MGTDTEFVECYNCNQKLTKEEPKSFEDKFEFQSRIINKVWDEDEQETLEEVAEIFFNKRAKEEGFENWTQIIVQQEWEFIESFPIEFAKWQQERMYSEEEVIAILENFSSTFDSITITPKQWFEQFKKK